MSSKPTVISTFAGGGGSSLGYHWAGYDELLAIDFDPHACAALKANFPGLLIWERDLNTVTGKEIMEACHIERGELDVLDGSPPCQGFSTQGNREVNDKRNTLFAAYARLVDELQPRVFIAENVTGLVKGDMKGTFKEIMSNLKALNYNVKAKVMNAMYYGVPQSRERVIIIGIRNDLALTPTFPAPSKDILTIGDALAGLGDQQDPAHDHYWLDESPAGRNTETFAKAAAARQGQGYAGFYRRERWNAPASTVTTFGVVGRAYLRNGHCHPLYNRTFSLLEVKRLCSFPDDYKLPEWYGFKICGNSVMPRMMEAIARHVKEKILGYE